LLGLVRARRHRVNAAFRQSPAAPPESRWEDDNPSMTLADAQQHRLLELLREAGEEPVAFCRPARRRD
jgi:hypothetical protein